MQERNLTLVHITKLTQLTQQMPAELILDGKAEKKQYQTKPNQYQHLTNPDSSTVKHN